jgi:hypothetical protein
MRRPRLSSGIASEKSALAAFAIPKDGAVEVVGADRREQGDRVDARHRVEHDVGADDGIRRGKDACGEPGAVSWVARAEDDVVTGAQEAGGEGLGDAAGSEDGDSHGISDRCASR